MREQGGTNFKAYDTIARERNAGIDSWAKRGLTKAGPGTLVPVNGGDAKVEQNHKRAILEALTTMSKGEARTLGKLREAVIASGFWSDPHSIAHVVWSLQKEGLVRFTERKGTGGVSILEHIGIRPLGRQKLESMRAGGAVLASQLPVKVTAPPPSRHPIGQDMTDYHHHGTVAVGGPVEKVQLPYEPAPKTASTSMKESGEVQAVQGLGKKIIEQAEKYPLVMALARRKSKMEAAARLLEDAGQEDLALSVLEKVVYTDFEKEVISLWEELQSLKLGSH
jgi:hypothetical protein